MDAFAFVSDCSGWPEWSRVGAGRAGSRRCRRRHRRRTGAPLAGWKEEVERGEDRRVVLVLSRRRAAGLGRRQQRGFWSCARHASVRLPVLPPPFSARRRAMSFCRGAVDHVNIIGVCCYQSAKQLLPKAARRPSMEAVVDRRRRAVARGAILPATTSPQHMHDPADHPPIIDPARPRTVLR